MACYCGLNQSFEQCCANFIDGADHAPEPELLMRSRYSAYASQNAEYLFNTTAREAQKENSQNDIAQWAAQTKWLKLTVKNASRCKITDFDQQSPPTVQFTAIYLHNNKLYQMSERSVFVVEDKQWKYLSGDILLDEQLSMPKRNDLCPCQSGKKFKRCCSSN